jgi:hypothetical protein
MRNRKMRTLFSDVIMGLLMAALLSVTITTTTEEVYAQVQYSPAAQNILDIVHSNCETLTTLVTDCVAIKYESPNLVVLDAKVFLNIESGGKNRFIWQAVDGFILLGYSVDSVVLNNHGSDERNPHEFIVVMTKP